MPTSDPIESANDTPPAGREDAAAAGSAQAAHAEPEIPATYRPGTGRRLTIVSAVLAIALGAAFLVVTHLKARDEAELAASTAARAKAPPLVEAIKVGAAPPTQTLQLPAEARGWYSTTIYARVNGYLARWLVDIGDKVTKDQVLAVIDTPDLDAQLDAAKAQLKAAEAEIKVKEADADFAKTTFDRWQGAAKGVVSVQEQQDKKAQYASAAAKLNEARARADLDRSNVNRLDFLTRYKQVTAPYDGVITERRTDIGDLVTAGSTSNTTPLYGIAQYDRVRIFVQVPQSASPDMTVGTSANVFAAETPSQIFHGKIARTAEAIDPRARTLRVEIDLPNPDGKLLPGMYLQAEFHLQSRRYVQIPASALLFRTSGPQVAVIQPDDTVTFRPVGIGRDNGNSVEIMSGLAEGDRVALNISNQIASGSKVSVKESNEVAAR